MSTSKTGGSEPKEHPSLPKKRSATGYFLLDFLLLNAAFFGTVLIHRGDLKLPLQYRTQLLLFNGVWLVSAFLSKTHQAARSRRLRRRIQPALRSVVYMSFLIFFMIFLFKQLNYSRFITLASLLFYAFLAMGTQVLQHLRKWGLDVHVVEDDDGQPDRSDDEGAGEIRGVDREKRDIRESLSSVLQESLGSDLSDVGAFLAEALRLEGIRASQSVLLETSMPTTIQGLLNDRWEFIGNLHKLNNFAQTNAYFIAVQKKLVPGGYFFGVGETQKQRFQRKFAHMSRILKQPMFILDFAWNRVFPKIALLRNLHFAIHGKSGKVISKQEIMGRLTFCGFRDIHLREIRNQTYFVAKKSQPPMRDQNPSSGVIFKQKRIGLNGEPIYAFKLRTMYPYSEYIHKYVLKESKLNAIGKIESDPRVPLWGAVLRRYWIDELPMLINFLQGDLKLVGLRPISRSFLNIYPPEMKPERVKYKPGLLPALYADRPTSIEAIFASEIKYMKRYSEHPWKTDFTYFFKILNSIIFHKARSA